jgi:hypothetical protein
MNSTVQLDWKVATRAGIIAGFVFSLEMVMVPLFGGGSPWGPPRMMAISQLSLRPTLAHGGVGGLILYLVNFYGFTALFPWCAMARNWISIFGHVVFGLVAAGVYVAIRKHHHHEEEHTAASLREKKA